MSEVITYGLVAIVLLVLVLAIVLGLAKAGRAQRAALKPKTKHGPGFVPIRRDREQAVEVKNNLPGLKLTGAVKNGPKRKIGKIIDEHPDEAITLIRHWLRENGNQSTG